MIAFKCRQVLLSGFACLSLSAIAPQVMAADGPALIDSGSFARDTTVNLERITLPGSVPERAPELKPELKPEQKAELKSEQSEGKTNSALRPEIATDGDNAQPIEASTEEILPLKTEKHVEASASYTEDAPRAIAQSTPQQRDADFVPIDLTPVRLPERTSAFSGLDSFKSQALYKLPGRVFFNATVENSLRFEANTFQTNRHYLSDMIYRVMPNVTVGYALDKKTRVAANYFFFRDQYTLRNNQLSRNIHSIGGRVDRDFRINEKTTATVGFMPRVLFINTANAPSYTYQDLLPSAMITRRVGQSGVIYGSIIGQIRWKGIFDTYQEFDQFYSIGGAWRKGPWNFLVDNTLVTNFGKRALRFGPNNQVIITTLEAGRRIHPKLPVTAFVRAEPIFNFGAGSAPGYSGFNFRIFGGLRAEIAKPAIFPIKLKQG